MTPSAAALAALGMGLLGSLHCAAMCGPLAVAGCGRGGARDLAGYVFGRFAAYATLGALMGHVGEHALCVLPVGTAELAAVALTAAPAAYRGAALLVRGEPRPRLVPLRRSARAHALAWFAGLLPRRGLGLGLATAVLPCGLLMSAWALAASTASPGAGALVMAVLSFASLPGLLVAIAGSRLALRTRLRFSPRVEGVLWCALAAWLVVRPVLAGGHCHEERGFADVVVTGGEPRR